MITTLQIQVLQAILDSDYQDEISPVDHQVWSWSVCGDHRTAGALGSLVKASLAGQCGHGEEATCWITQAGLDALNKTKASSKGAA